MHRMALFVTKDRMQFKYKVSEYQEKTVKKVNPFTSFCDLTPSQKKAAGDLLELAGILCKPRKNVTA